MPSTSFDSWHLNASLVPRIVKEHNQATDFVLLADKYDGNGKI